MASRKTTRRRRRQAQPSPSSSTRNRAASSQASGDRPGHDQGPPSSTAWRSLDTWLHLRESEEPPWRYLPHILALAFAIRALVALAGDFVLHPDEIMQYLEPAHRLAFGNGVIYWEFFYGARSWLVPGAVAGVLKLFQLAGAAQPAWYVAGVKLAFCALSLAIPAGMYFFARSHFGERSARAALIAGAFWYELAAFAHKPMTEFVATGLVLALLALAFRPAVETAGTAWKAAFLAILATAIRVQYAVPALALLAVLFVRTSKRTQLVLATAAFALAIGVFDALTWGGGLFHSYVTNIRFNLAVGDMRAGESPWYQYLAWLVIAGGGLSALSAGAAVFRPRRYAFLLALAALVIATHSLQAHKEYRFIFVVIPIWLLILADISARLMNGRRWALLASAFAAVSVAGLANALPRQASVYKAWSGETGAVRFLGSEDPIFAAYRYLATAPGVKAVLQADRPYFIVPGYYYLHRDVPLYDAVTISVVRAEAEAVRASVSHIVTADPATYVPGYSLEREFGEIRILRREDNAGDVRQWESRTPTSVSDGQRALMDRIVSNPPVPPENSGIRFVDGEALPASPR